MFASLRSKSDRVAVFGLLIPVSIVVMKQKSGEDVVFYKKSPVTLQGLRRCVRFAQNKPRPRCGIRFSSLEYCFSEIKKAISNNQLQFSKKSDAAGIRTPNLLIRSQVLYPVKLQRHWIGENTIFI